MSLPAYGGPIGPYVITNRTFLGTRAFPREEHAGDECNTRPGQEKGDGEGFAVQDSFKQQDPIRQIPEEEENSAKQSQADAYERGEDWGNFEHHKDAHCARSHRQGEWGDKVRDD